MNAICPEALTPEWEFARELFPGCAPPPYWWLGVTCDGDKCPRPCRARYETGRAPATAWFRYDQHGRWQSTLSWSGGLRDGRFADELPRPAANAYCSRDGGRGTCRHWGINGPNETDMIFTYDEAGHVTSFQEASDDRGPAERLEYDANGFLTRELVRTPDGGFSPIEHHYNANGRIELSTWLASKRTRRYQYDSRGLLVSIADIDAGAYSMLHSTTTFEYDSERRPVRLIRTDESGPSRSLFRLEYDYKCPVVPDFLPAIAILERLEQEACSCADVACAERATRELTRLSQDPEDPFSYQDDDYGHGRRIGELFETIRRCLARKAAPGTQATP